MDTRIKEKYLLASRGGSKTYDFIKGNLYFCSIGYTWVFFVSEGSMIDEPQSYLEDIMDRQWLQEITKYQLKREIKFKNGGWFQLRNLTKKKARSPRRDGVTFDELAQADEDAYDAASAITSNSALAQIWDGTTPILGSQGHTVWKGITNGSIEGALITRRHELCPYIKRSFIEKMRKKLPPWFFRQEFECSWEAPSGRIFTNVVHGDYLKEMEGLQKRSWVRTYTHYGLDWNPVAGHYLVGSRWDRNKTKVFVTVEKNLGNDPMIAIKAIIEILLQNPKSHLEMEDGGTNVGFCEWFFQYIEDTYHKQDYATYIDLLTRCGRRPWDSQGKNKMRAVTLLFPRTILVDDLRTPEVSVWLDKASWDDEATDFPKVLKDPDQHPLDGFLHSAWCGYYQGVT